MPKDFRFSHNLERYELHTAVVSECRRAEQLGYDAVYAADHLGVAAPFQLLVAAALATERLRVGTLVLNTPFWNPALLAREASTADILSGGRLELGLGAGHMKWEFDEAGIPWRPFSERADHLRETVVELGRLFASEGYEQEADVRAAFGLPALRPVQRTGFDGSGPPVLIGGTGNRVLDLAAEHADIVGIAGLLQVEGTPPGTMRLLTAAEADGRVRRVRERARARADRIEWQVLVQTVVETEDRAAEAGQLLDRYGKGMTRDQLLDCPFLLFGTVEEMARQVLWNRQRYGFTHYTVHGPYAEAFAPVITRVRELEARG